MSRQCRRDAAGIVVELMDERLGASSRSRPMNENHLVHILLAVTNTSIISSLVSVNGLNVSNRGRDYSTSSRSSSLSFEFPLVRVDGMRRYRIRSRKKFDRHRPRMTNHRKLRSEER